MRTNRPVIFFFSAFWTLICISIFSAALETARPASAKDVPAAKNVPPKTAPTPFSGATTGFTAALPDPERPGKMLYELRGKSGFLQSGGSGFRGSAQSVWARLYQSGVSSAILTAPQAQISSAGKSAVTVTGTGGVVVKSLVEPGTLLTADRVVWQAGTNKITATGHVFYKNGKTGATLTGPRMIADTRVKSIYVTGGGHGTATL